MGYSKYRGNQIEFVNNVWLYSDNKYPVAEDKNRVCGHCGKPQTYEGHAGCLGTLDKVLNACCGHGIAEEAYIQFVDNTEIRGVKAVEYMKTIGGINE